MHSDSNTRADDICKRHLAQGPVLRKDLYSKSFKADVQLLRGCYNGLIAAWCGFLYCPLQAVWSREGKIPDRL